MDKPMGRCSVSIRSSVHYRLKERCKELDASMAEVIETLVNKYLDAADKGEIDRDTMRFELMAYALKDTFKPAGVKP